jgi:hypothetical protein
LPKENQALCELAADLGIIHVMLVFAECSSYRVMEESIQFSNEGLVG